MYMYMSVAHAPSFAVRLVVVGTLCGHGGETRAQSLRRLLTLCLWVARGWDTDGPLPCATPGVDSALRAGGGETPDLPAAPGVRA